MNLQADVVQRSYAPIGRAWQNSKFTSCFGSLATRLGIRRLVKMGVAHGVGCSLEECTAGQSAGADATLCRRRTRCGQQKGYSRLAAVGDQPVGFNDSMRSRLAAPETLLTWQWAPAAPPPDSDEQPTPPPARVRGHFT